MTNSGINPPECDALWNRKRAAQFGRLTNQRQQPVRFSKKYAQLIHYSAGSAGHKILDLLTKQRQFAWLDRKIECRHDGLHH